MQVCGAHTTRNQFNLRINPWWPQPISLGPVACQHKQMLVGEATSGAIASSTNVAFSWLRLPSAKVIFESQVCFTKTITDCQQCLIPFLTSSGLVIQIWLFALLNNFPFLMPAVPSLLWCQHSLLLRNTERRR